MAKSQKSVIGQRAEELCKRFPSASNLSLARKLHAEFSCTVTVDEARSRIRYVRGANGKGNRKYASQLQDRSHLKTPPLPPSVAKPWTPFEIKGSKKVGIISDLHVPYHSDVALEAALDHLEKERVDTIVINGDAADFYACSRWDKNPNRIGLRAEMELFQQVLLHLRARFKKTRIIYKAGNHEERWNKYIWSKAPEVWDLDPLQLHELLKLKSHSIEWVDDQRPMLLGKLPILHGHELPKGISSPVNAARGAWMRTKHTVLVGHSHQTSGHCEPDLWHSECFVWSIGCLCDMTPEYARVNRWNHGFAVVGVGKDGSFDVTNLRISKNGTVRGG